MPEKHVGRVTPLYDAAEANDLLPTEMDGRIRADAIVAEVNARRRENPDVDTDSALEALQIPKAKASGITIKIDPVERQITVYFKDNYIGFIKWAASQGKYLIQRRVLLDGPFTDHQPVRYFCDLPQAWRVCCEYGITTQEFQQAFRDLPPAVEWTFDKCAGSLTQRRGMDCKLYYWNPEGSPHSTALPDIKCRTCGAVFAMNEQAQLTLKEGPSAPIEPLSVAAQPPGPSRPSRPFTVDFLRYNGGTKAKLHQLEEAGVTSWEELAGKNVEWLLSIGWRKELAEFMLEIAKENADVRN